MVYLERSFKVNRPVAARWGAQTRLSARVQREFSSISPLRRDRATAASHATLDVNSTRTLSAAALALGFGCIIDAQPIALPGPAISEPRELAIQCDLPYGSPDVVAVIAVDGVRWQEIFEGVDRRRAAKSGLPVVEAATLMPNLHWLATARGAALGAPGRGTISASGPNFVSLPGYVELFTGGPSIDCQHNLCPPVSIPTLADEFTIDGDPGEVAVFASWPTLARAVGRQPDRMLVSIGRDGTNMPDLLGSPSLLPLLHEGEEAAPAPGYGSYRPDAKTAPLALAYLRERAPRFLFVGLGDTDEHAHHNDYASYLEALRHADRFIGDVAITLSAMSAEGTSTLLFVTSDHGRAESFAQHGGAWPESGRVWLVAAGDAVRARGRVTSPAPRHLADVGATIRALSDLEPAATSGMVLTELFDAPPALQAARIEP